MVLRPGWPLVARRAGLVFFKINVKVFEAIFNFVHSFKKAIVNNVGVIVVSISIRDKLEILFTIIAFTS